MKAAQVAGTSRWAWSSISPTGAKASGVRAAADRATLLRQLHEAGHRLVLVEAIA